MSSARDWRKKNPEKAKSYRIAYVRANKLKVSRSKKVWADKNRETLREKARIYYHASYKRRAREAQLMREFGITMEEYEHILDAQGGVCAICEGESDARGRDFAVDHDHFTGKIRGILCRGCNVGIGNLKEDVETLKRAIKYLESPRGTILRGR